MLRSDANRLGAGFDKGMRAREQLLQLLGEQLPSAGGNSWYVQTLIFFHAAHTPFCWHYVNVLL